MGDARHAEAGEIGPPSPQERIEEAGPPYGCALLLVLCPLLRDVIALKNADHLLSDVMKAVDTDGDGVIKYNGQPARLDTLSTPADPVTLKNSVTLLSRQKTNWQSCSRA